eukprot:scaffold170735_cov32-Prasinocladus_malaysianus.AAC.1
MRYERVLLRATDAVMALVARTGTMLATSILKPDTVLYKYAHHPTVLVSVIAPIRGRKQDSRQIAYRYSVKKHWHNKSTVSQMHKRQKHDRPGRGRNLGEPNFPASRELLDGASHMRNRPVQVRTYEECHSWPTEARREQSPRSFDLVHVIGHQFGHRPCDWIDKAGSY